MKPLWYYRSALTFIFVGLIALGAAAGIRIAYGQAASTLDCAALIVGQPTPCQALLMELNEFTKILLGGGIATMLSGMATLYWLRNTTITTDQ